MVPSQTIDAEVDMNDVSLAPAKANGVDAGAISGYRDIAVHLDGTAADEVRLAHAEALAVRFGGRLNALYTNELPDPAIYAGDFGMTAIGELTEAVIQDGDGVERRLRERMARVSSLQQMRRLESFPGLLNEAVTRVARWNDLFVASCPRGDDTRWQSLIESVMFDGGRGLYLIPPTMAPRGAIRSVMIAWADTRESARAVAEAMPFITGATEVHLVTVREDAHGRMGGAEIMADIASHLAHYGVSTTVAALPQDGTTSGALLQAANRKSVDLVVAGAYGHSRFREWILGGVTRDLLANAAVPLLLAH